MKVYRCFTPRVGTRKERYLGHWYADTPQIAMALARAHEEKTTGKAYTWPIDAAISAASDKAFNADPLDHTKPKR